MSWDIYLQELHSSVTGIWPVGSLWDVHPGNGCTGDRPKCMAHEPTYGGFSLINHPAIGIPPFMETHLETKWDAHPSSKIHAVGRHSGSLLVTFRFWLIYLSASPVRMELAMEIPPLPSHNKSTFSIARWDCHTWCVYLLAPVRAYHNRGLVSVQLNPKNHQLRLSQRWLLAKLLDKRSLVRLANNYVIHIQ